MNVIVSNKYHGMLETLDIDIIKSITGEFDVDDIIGTFDNFFFQRMILDITAIKGYKDVKTIQKLSIALDMSKIILLLDDSPECSSNEYLSKLISMGVYNFTKNTEGIMYLYNNPNSYRDVAHIQQLDVVTPAMPSYGDGQVATSSGGTKIIGVKSVTKEAGATTLIYLMKKELEKNYSVTAFEIDKRDFSYFKDEGLISTTSTSIGLEIAKNKSEAILIDLNNNRTVEDLCETVIYLLEPSIIKLNRLLAGNTKILGELSEKKVVLSKSLLTPKDVGDFENESGMKIFFNMPPVNERELGNNDVNKLLVNLGFSRQSYDK